MPNKENILKWCEALESGKYHQISEQLRRGKLGRCCLGVACDVAIADNPEIGKWDAEIFRTPQAGGEKYELPQPVCDWLGVYSSDPIILGMFATELNDNECLAFDVIAHKLRVQYGLPILGE